MAPVGLELGDRLAGFSVGLPGVPISVGDGAGRSPLDGVVVHGEEEDRTGTSVEERGELHRSWELDLIATKDATEGDGATVLWLDGGFAEDMLANEGSDTVSAD
jgi:hypothetical protein